MKDIHKSENLHIIFWLAKDVCWIMEWQILGIIMIVPTVLMAVYIAVKTKHENVYYINLAILAWITANAYWMICELTDHLHLKDYAMIGFLLGFVFSGIFFWKESKVSH